MALPSVQIKIPFLVLFGKDRHTCACGTTLQDAVNRANEAMETPTLVVPMVLTTLRLETAVMTMGTLVVPETAMTVMGMIVVRHEPMVPAALTLPVNPMQRRAKDPCIIAQMKQKHPSSTSPIPAITQEQLSHGRFTIDYEEVLKTMHGQDSDTGPGIGGLHNEKLLALARPHTDFTIPAAAAAVESFTLLGSVLGVDLNGTMSNYFLLSLLVLTYFLHFPSLSVLTDANEATYSIEFGSNFSL